MRECMAAPFFYAFLNLPFEHAGASCGPRVEREKRGRKKRKKHAVPQVQVRQIDTARIETLSRV